MAIAFWVAIAVFVSCTDVQEEQVEFVVMPEATVVVEVPKVPEVTPTPEPIVPVATPQEPSVTAASVASGPLTRDGMVGVLLAAGWPQEQVENALSVAKCESSWNPDVTGGAGEWGLFQIHPVHVAKFSGRDPYDPVVNASVALRIWKDQSWGPWTCQP